MLSLFFAATASMVPTAGLYMHSRTGHVPTLAMQFGSPLPPEVAVVLKPSSPSASRGGAPMVVGTEKELRALWNAMIQVYGNRNDALAAVRKN